MIKLHQNFVGFLLVVYNSELIKMHQILIDLSLLVKIIVSSNQFNSGSFQSNRLTNYANKTTRQATRTNNHSSQLKTIFNFHGLEFQ